MKKSILFTVLLSLLAVIAYAQKLEAPKRQGWNDWYGPLYGDVESVTITSYKLTEKLGKIVKDDIINKKWFYRFNQKGDVIEAAQYNSDGSLDCKYTYKYKYDLQGNRIEAAQYNSDGSLNWKCTYKYDSQGNKVEEIEYTSDGSLFGKSFHKSLCKYDSHGNLIECINYVGESMKPTLMIVLEIVYRK